MANAPYLVTAPIEQAVNAYLALDAGSPDKLADIEGKVVELDLQGPPNLKLYFIPELGKLRVTGYCDQAADAVIRATPLALTRMALSDSADQSLFGNGVTLLGDTGLATRIQTLLANADIDWEEHLSHIVGDIAAHQIGRGARGLLDWGKQVLQTAQMNSDEYLHEELRATPLRREVDDFMNDVDKLRADVERAAARMNRLLQKQAK
jgi:ubiquinone biosynthesis protein UbiJ